MRARGGAFAFGFPLVGFYLFTPHIARGTVRLCCSRDFLLQKRCSGVWQNTILLGLNLLKKSNPGEQYSTSYKLLRSTCTCEPLRIVEYLDIFSMTVRHNIYHSPGNAISLKQTPVQYIPVLYLNRKCFSGHEVQQIALSRTNNLLNVFLRR